jgi:hypothetical protein
MRNIGKWEIRVFKCCGFARSPLEGKGDKFTLARLEELGG